MPDAACRSTGWIQRLPDEPSGRQPNVDVVPVKGLTE